jgi:adenosine deaminase CECR1
MESDNADWELEEGLPQFEDPFIQQYLKGRDALIAEEQKRRHGEILVKRYIHEI